LIDKGADVNANGHGRTALMRAAASGHLEIVKALLAADADVELRVGSIFLSALDEARKYERHEIIGVLKRAV
jgi:ankyrin repeat protein